MKYTYPAVFHAEDDGFWVEFSDISGCFSQGDTETDALQNASEALEAYIGECLDENKSLPAPSDIQKIKTDKDSFSSFVTCSIRSKEKSVKKTLTIPEWLNKKAEAAGINFSQVLQDSLKKKLQLS